MPEETARVSVVGRSLSFLTEILAARGCGAEKPQNVGAAKILTRNV